MTGDDLLAAYNRGPHWCEILGGNGAASDHGNDLRTRLAGFSLTELMRRADLAERELYNLGITFTVYSERDAIDRILPFDVLPRILSADDWETI